MNPRIPRSAPHAAFSLVELVVVMAIIIIVIGLLMPAFAGVQSTARSTTCRNNLRQMALAAIQYTHAHQYFPPAVRSEQRDGTLAVISWDYTTSFDGKTILGPGALWQDDTPLEAIHRCPLYEGPKEGGRPATGYNYNTTYLGGEGPLMVPGWKHFRGGERYSGVSRSATCAIFGCGGRCGGDDAPAANRYMRAPGATVEDLYTVYSGGQAYRHRRSTNVVYVDGHIAPHHAPHRGMHATETLLDTLLCYPDNGFLSDNDDAYRPR